jgi:hypothetical protein
MLNRHCEVLLPHISGGDEDLFLSTIAGYASLAGVYLGLRELLLSNNFNTSLLRQIGFRHEVPHQLLSGIHLSQMLLLRAG